MKVGQSIVSITELGLNIEKTFAQIKSVDIELRELFYALLNIKGYMSY